MKPIRIIFAGVFALMVVTACQEEVEYVMPSYDDAYYAGIASVSSDDASFSASDNGGTVKFIAEGGKVVLKVDCGVEWVFDNSMNDIFPTEADVNGGTLTISAMQNIDEERNVDIVLRTDNLGIEFATITVTQNAYGAPVISADTYEWYPPAVGAVTTEIGVYSSLGYFESSIGDGCDWLVAEVTDSGVLITATENEETEERSAEVTLTADDGIQSDSVVIKVTQDASAYVSLSIASIFAAAAGEESTVTIRTNYDWSYRYDTSNDWFSVKNSGNDLTVAISAFSETDGSRVGIITVTASDGAENVASASIAVLQCGGNNLVLEYTTTVPNQNITLPLSGTVNCTVDWGDGSDAENVTSASPTHTYSETGLHYIIVNGTVTAINSESFSFGYDPDMTLTGVKQWGITGLTNLYRAFYFCEGLSYIPEVTGDVFAEVTNLQGMFECCFSLTSVPGDLFVNCSKNTNFSRVFYYCSALETIGEGFHFNCPDATAASYTFCGCEKLKTIPEGLFSGCSKVKSFTYVFYNCSNLKTVPAAVFSGCEEATDFSYAFYGCTSLNSVSGDMFKGCKSVTNFKCLFYNCTDLGSIPEDLIKDCTEVKDLEYAFYHNAITSIPENLLVNCTKVTSFEATFYRTNITEIPEKLFYNCVSAKSFYWTFGWCRELLSVPSKLFVNNTAVTNFSHVFYDCEVLASVGNGLFETNTKVTDFSNVFYACFLLNNIPTNLFDSCMNVTDFTSAFHGLARWTTETPFTEVNVSGETVKVHIYERENYTKELGCAVPTGPGCFSWDVNVTDYYDIPAEWGGEGGTTIYSIGAGCYDLDETGLDMASEQLGR